MPAVVFSPRSQSFTGFHCLLGGDGMEPVFEETANNDGAKSKKEAPACPSLVLKKKAATGCLNVKTSPYIPQVTSHDLMRQTVCNLVICSICCKLIH